jgi:hypothetical protein
MYVQEILRCRTTFHSINHSFFNNKKTNIMATIVSVTLNPLTLSGENVIIKVDYKLSFTESERGKSFKLIIGLYGDDSGEGGGGLPTIPPPSFEEFEPLHLMAFSYTYRHSDFRNVTIQRKFTNIKATALTIDGSITNEVKATILDEDPGRIDIGTPVGTRRPVYIAIEDEIFARVMLVPIAEIKKSAIQKVRA